MSLAGKILISEVNHLRSKESLIYETENKGFQSDKISETKLFGLKKGLATGLTGLVLYASSLGFFGLPLGLTGCSLGVNGIVLPEQPEISQEELQERLYFEGAHHIKTPFEAIDPYVFKIIEYYEENREYMVGFIDPKEAALDTLIDVFFRNDQDNYFKTFETERITQPMNVNLNKKLDPNETRYDLLSDYINEAIDEINTKVLDKFGLSLKRTNGYTYNRITFYVASKMESNVFGTFHDSIRDDNSIKNISIHVKETDQMIESIWKDFPSDNKEQILKKFKRVYYRVVLEELFQSLFHMSDTKNITNVVCSQDHDFFINYFRNAYLTSLDVNLANIIFSLDTKITYNQFKDYIEYFKKKY